MKDHASALTERLIRADWHGGFNHTRSRVALMKEYLRRAALWSHQLRAEQWPFFDAAALANPNVRAGEELVSEIIEKEEIIHQFPLVMDTCVWALHFSALRDSGEALPDLPDMFDPLVIFYERGGGFGIDTTGMIQVDYAAMKRGSPASHRADKAKTSIDAEALDLLDR
ncbi:MULTISPECIES: hypothetical protein [Nocardiopsidaceae]|uniref:Uncharacterized protein n=1 Tax=Streptomonospora nanhaiensis TaxID=1323731 RepID=A0ABY6YT29_9ACTN|nr:hypothetical protein [Streptomonospora nanhaiensis]WAE75525.1 hypothetical protein OUQ99_10780 [Streptomonospora nanhaiensis]